jgi:flagellar protein FlaG
MASNGDLSVSAVTGDLPRPLAPVSSVNSADAIQRESTDQDTVQSPQTTEFTVDELEQVATALGDAAEVLNRSVRFEVDASSGQLITQVVNRDTNEVIRQIPPAELIRIATRLRDFLGLVFNSEA